MAQCVIDPGNGAKIHSIIGLKRRLGLADAPPPLPPPMPTAAVSGGEGEHDGDEGGAAASAASSGGGQMGGSTRHQMSEQQVEELITAVETMRRRSTSTDEYVHGWRLIYTLRGGHGSTRGDMTAIDPTDGQKIFSLVGLKRKLNGEGDMWENVMEKARRSAAEELGEDPNGPRKRRKVDLGFGEVMYERERRNRTVVNYAEKQSAHGGVPLSAQILSVVEDHASAIKPAVDAGHSAADAASSQATDAAATDASASAAAATDADGATGAASSAAAGSSYAGLDYLSIALGVHARQHGSHSRAFLQENVPLGNVRQVMSQLLKSGKLRRILACAPTPATSSASASVAGSSTAHALKMLVLNSLQVEPDEGAPWAIPAGGGSGGASSGDGSEDGGGDGGKTNGSDGEGVGSGETVGSGRGPRRTHVWKGATPSQLPSLSGAALVGRRIEVWWGGDGVFHPAVVTGYNEWRCATGYVDASAGTHVLRYDNGMRTIESLEGDGDPQLWRLTEAEGGAEATSVPEEELDPTIDDATEGEEGEEGEEEGGGEEEGDDVEMDVAEADDEEEAAPPVRVLLVCRGCEPVGTIGTAAYEARKQARAAALQAGGGAAVAGLPSIVKSPSGKATKRGARPEGAPPPTELPLVNASLVGTRIEVYWELDRAWYACRVIDFVPADGTVFVRYFEDGMQEYLHLGWRRDGNGNWWRLAGTAEADPALASSVAEEDGSEANAEREEAEGEEDVANMKMETDGEGGGGGAGGEEASQKAGFEAAAAGGAAAAAAGDSSSFGDWRAKGPRMELAITLNTIRAQLPLSDRDPSRFAAPPGWVEHVTKGSEGRRIGSKWIRLPAPAGAPPAQRRRGGPARPKSVSTRAELEELLEEEARAEGGAWLGQLVDGLWEVRRRHVDEALEWVVGELVGGGLARTISGEACGKGQGLLVCAANRYVRGEAFPITRKKAEKEEDAVAQDDEEELCDFEQQRLRNIERNKEILRSLGLA